MPVADDCSPSEGEAEPASTFLSPVARDYPSRALRGFFMPGGASTVPSKNSWKRAPEGRQSHVLVLHNLFTIWTL
jgi:hypothetical protein